jgi:hypothetical protein
MSTGICANPALRGHHSVTTILIAGSCVATASKNPSILAQSALIENGDENDKAALMEGMALKGPTGPGPP